MNQKQEAFERWKARLVKVEFSWERQFLHEAGHAGSSLVLLDHDADIVAMNYVDKMGVRQMHARFMFNPGLKFPAPGLSVPPFHEQKLLEQAKVIAAGGMAEAVFLGQASDGMTGDLVKIRQLVENPLVPQDIRDAIEREANDDFPDTQRLLVGHGGAVMRIRDVVYAEFQRLGLDRQDDFGITVVLPAAEVRRLFQGASQK